MNIGIKSAMVLSSVFFSAPIQAADLSKESLDLLNELSAEATELTKLNKQAEECFPEIGGKESIFCTGIRLSKNEAEALLSLNLEQCHREISKRGYQAFVDKKPQNLSQEDFSQFLATSP